MMTVGFKKIVLVVLAAILLIGGGAIQRSLNTDREQLGLTHGEVLNNAPPVLAFTTVALGGFRGLISNLLWMRATKLQDEDKFFEMVQLADWITKLEPHFTQVWLVQAWNMAFNISVKFKDFSDRWHWVERGIELLRDEGLKYNPGDLLIYRELGWMFQFKIGNTLDDANNYYKRAWFDEMNPIFPEGKPDFEAYTNPTTDADKARERLLRDRYKLDPEIIKLAEDQCGPLEWRLPEAHAIYWAIAGLQQIKAHPERSNPEDTMTLRRMIYQSMHQAVLQGRIDYVPPVGNLELSPRLELLKKTSDAYERALQEEPEINRDGIRRAHRNLIRDAVFYLYTYDRRKEAAAWFDYLAKKYPKGDLIRGMPGSSPLTMGLDEYCIARVEELAQEANSQIRTRLILEGLLASALKNLAVGEDSRYLGYKNLAQRILERFRKNTATAEDRVSLPSLNEIERSVALRMLSPESGMPEELANQLRTALKLESSNTPAGDMTPR